MFTTMQNANTDMFSAIQDTNETLTHKVDSLTMSFQSYSEQTNAKISNLATSQNKLEDKFSKIDIQFDNFIQHANSKIFYI